MDFQDELTQLRSRIAELRDAIGRRSCEQTERTVRRLVKVIDKGNKPTVPGKFIAATIQRLRYPVVEGGPGTLLDTGEVLHVAFLYDQVPDVGTLIVAKRVDNRWAASMPGAITCPIIALGCRNGGVPDAMVTLSKDGTLVASGMTTVAGTLCVSIPHGSYDVDVAPPAGSGFAAYSGSITYDGTTQHVTLVPDADHVCTTCCNYPIPKTIRFTDDLGEHALTYNPPVPPFVGPFWACTATAPAFTKNPDGSCSPGGTMTVTYKLVCTDSGTFGSFFSMAVGWRMLACADETLYEDDHETFGMGPSYPDAATVTGSAGGVCWPLDLTVDLPTEYSYPVVGGGTISSPTPGGGGSFPLTA
jgi:hypothetical protein